ncbi:hypothetical protein VITU102760_24270 [Vibrio tubiashii]|uniref:Uncharacterized protein n=1 Tax=Vibrio tubiashii ATCC 19109 TaxID=1051646 RepID=F9T599_9VIBR|nr:MULTISPECIES: hypothetical protein [Vibrio oreintalis group]AIW17452.1 hypothetical protein IX91_25685 [Vibrio tubiashii ATCC 19109]EGU55296.1 hypothetical protein VITU9109_21159 [Vibrio tubiashii ATCC 19109]EIF04422.1 hypothetical protein VT1337_08646 [Vibrio tubiashii NCIMB 1337 = ATCC 19106]MDC5841126.1 hypothetical protein [Vibrio europaeus]MDC5870540.1 hypothetical protein [Vibrio europaeus]
MKITIALILSLFFSVASVSASECDADFIAHNQKVESLINIGNVELADAQRDCLAVELGKVETGKSICPAFRNFEQEFLTLPKATQISYGYHCKKQLLKT